MDDTVRISGRALLGVLRYSKKLGGADGPGAIISSLGEADREIFARPLRGASWYPYSAYAGLLEAIEHWPGHEHEDLLIEMGRWGLRRDAGTVLKILSVFSSIDGLVHRGFGSWGGYLWSRHCDAGEVFLADSGAYFGAMGLRNFPTISRAHCWMNLGYLEAMGHAVGASAIRMSKTRCVHRGDAYCEYRGEWD